MGGMMIAFEGTDGSGKSTIIDSLPDALKDEFESIDYYHWRPGVIKSEKNTTKKVVTEPHAKKPYGRVKSFAKFMFFNLDYTFGYFFKVKKQKQSGHLVVFDRYYYDYYLDKIRYRLTISDKTLDFFRHFIPKPDITFLLIGDAQLLYERKKEISVKEIQEQIDRLIKNKSKFNNSVTIDVNHSIEKVVEDVVETIRKARSKK